MALCKNELAALGLVHREPMHGYNLTKAIQRMGLERWTTLSRSSIYTALHRLSRRGAVSAVHEREGAGPERVVHHITPYGRQLLQGLVREALGYVGPEDRLFYLGLAFAEALPVHEVLSILRRRRQRLEEEVRAAREACARASDLDLPFPHFRETTEAGIRHHEVELDVCTMLIRAYEEAGFLAPRAGGIDA